MTPTSPLLGNLTFKPYPTTDSVPKELARVWLARDLIGMHVVSQSDEALGKIDDLVVHPDGHASYAVLSIGGWLGLGDKLFAMPMTVLRATESDADGKRSVVLPLSKEQLERAPGFDKKHWPDLANPNWAYDVDHFYAGGANPNTTLTAERALRASAATFRVSQLKGTPIHTFDDEILGEIKDLAIDTNGRVRYVVVSVGGFLGIGDRLIVVPWDSLSFSYEIGGEEKRIALAITKQQVEDAPEFQAGAEHAALMCDPTWINGVYAYYSRVLS